MFAVFPGWEDMTKNGLPIRLGRRLEISLAYYSRVWCDCLHQHTFRLIGISVVSDLGVYMPIAKT